MHVSWGDALAYCRWLSKVTGSAYGLPSEAEWEEGARGTDGQIYPWGNEWDAVRCNSRESGLDQTTWVYAYPEGASPYGVLDMAGNVWEWTRSLWGFTYLYQPTDGRENLEAPSDAPRVRRSGAFDSALGGVRCAYRDGDGPLNRGRFIGLRVVVLPAS